MERIVANINSIIYGCNNLDILLLISDVSSYKNKLERKVPKHDTNPKKLLFNPKNNRV